MGAIADIERFTGEGFVSHHVPTDISLIPFQTIRTYSPRMDGTSGRPFVRLEPFEDPENENNFLAKFTVVEGSWDPAAIDFLTNRLVLDYDPVLQTLLATDIHVTDDWWIKEYRVHRTSRGEAKRDFLTWVRKKEGTLQELEVYPTVYVWCADA